MQSEGCLRVLVCKAVFFYLLNILVELLRRDDAQKRSVSADSVTASALKCTQIERETRASTTLAEQPICALIHCSYNIHWNMCATALQCSRNTHKSYTQEEYAHCLRWGMRLLHRNANSNALECSLFGQRVETRSAIPTGVHCCCPKLVSTTCCAF